MLTRLIYFSENNLSHGLLDIRSILKSANRNNTEMAISGVLYHNEHFFLQVLEGGRKEVSQVFQKISSDKRHSHIVIVSVEDIPERFFERWSMLYVSEASLEKSAIIKFMPHKEFNPTQMSCMNIKKMAMNLIPKSEEEDDDIQDV